MIGGMDIVNPVNIGEGTVPAVDHTSPTDRPGVLRCPAPGPSERPLPEEVRAERFGDVPHTHSRHRSQYRVGAVSYQLDRMPGPGQERGKCVVRLVHPAGPNEVAGDQDERSAECGVRNTE